MVRKIGIAIAALLLIVSIIGAVWVRSVFAHDTVRAALAAQMSSALGQPVSIGGIGASIYPRVTVRLNKVTIGQPVRIQAETLRLGTDLGALFSRQIVHGSVRLDGAKVQLPLISLGAPTSSTSTKASSGAPVEIVSIDEIILNNVDIVSGGRLLRGDIEAVPHGAGATLRRVSLSAEDTSLTGSGEISDLTGPVGNITIKAGALNLTRLLDFLTAFSSGSGMSGSRTPSRSAPGATPTNLTLSFTADKATMGTLTLAKLSARGHVTQDGVTLNPMEFGVFGGSYKGATTLTTAGATSMFRLNAALSNIDVAAATAYAGSPGTISGTMSGQIDVSGQSANPAGLMNAASGTARIDIRDGVAKNLGLVKTIVIATSGRSDAQVPSSSRGSNDEPFKRLGATLKLANGTVRTDDLQFESPDVLMRAAGSLRLDGSAMDLRGDVQLSEALTQQAGRDLVRYTQEQGRVTLPVTISGPAQSPSVRVDMASLANRALQNKAKDELQKAIGGLFKKK
jgi:type II secretion system protein N